MSDAPFVLVTGGKGGVGKSLLAANLAVLLAEEGTDPLLVDFDLGLGNLGVILRLEPTFHSGDFLNGERELSECIAEGPSGIGVVPAGSGEASLARGDADHRRSLFDAVRAMPAERRIVVGDSAAGIGPDVLDLASRADRVLVVTTPDPAAVTDAYGVIKALDRHAEENDIEIPTPDVVVNLAPDAAEAQGVAAKLRAVCERFLSRSPRLVGWLPRSRAVSRSIASGEPFVLSDPRSPAARSLRRLARRFAELAPENRPESRPLKGSRCHAR